MHTDCFYNKGYSHKVCQDFIIDGITSQGIHYVILADGCSSQPKTDIGARILVLEAMKMLQDYNWGFFDLKDVFTHITQNAIDYINRVKLSRECLTATLIILAVDDKKVRILGMGDGGFAIIPSQKDMEIGGKFNRSLYRTNSFSDNYPIYPIYLHEPNLYIPESNVMTKHLVTLYTNEAMTTEHTCDFSPSLNHEFDASYVNFVGIFSDGLESFIDQESNSIPLKEIMKRVTAFKHNKGEFIQRRLKSFLKESEKLDWNHYDDLSFGGIYLGG